VAKDYINFHLDIGAPITQGAWIVDTGWVKEQPQPQPIPSPIPTPTPTPQPTKLYRVQVGAYSKRENADAMATQLKAAGFNCYIKYE
jgi:cell division septation protein DedD